MQSNGINSDLVILVYNGQREVVVNRQNVANSCIYLQKLLAGPFRESRLERIDIHLGEDFSFVAFERVLKFASDGSFIREPKKHINIYYGMIQLADLWMYYELIDILSGQLALYIDLDTIVDTHTIAIRLKLNELEQKCKEYEADLDRRLGTPMGNWGSCPKIGHEKAPYENCHVCSTENKMAREDWDSEEPQSLTEQERIELAELRFREGPVYPSLRKRPAK